MKEGVMTKDTSRSQFDDVDYGEGSETEDGAVIQHSSTSLTKDTSREAAVDPGYYRGQCPECLSYLNSGDGHNDGCSLAPRGQRALAYLVTHYGTSEQWGPLVAELERLQRIEALLREWWIKPTAANWIALRAALATDGAETS